MEIINNYYGFRSTVICPYPNLKGGFEFGLY